MITVWKHLLINADHQIIDLPGGCEALHAGLDPVGDPCLWAKVDTERPLRGFHVYVVGTGNPMPEGSVRFVGTVVRGPFVQHVFVR